MWGANQAVLIPGSPDRMADMPLNSVHPRGIFHARQTKDATAMDRDGHIFVLMNELSDATGNHPTVEIMFEDGFWMLATPGDLGPLE